MRVSRERERVIEREKESVIERDGERETERKSPSKHKDNRTNSLLPVKCCTSTIGLFHPKGQAASDPME